MDERVQDGWIPWDDIPDSNVVPNGIYQCRGEEMASVQSSTGKKMFSVQFSIEQPDEFASKQFEYFVIGTDDDPQATIVKTWKKSVGARLWKQLCRAAQLPNMHEEAKICAAFPSALFLVSATRYTEEKGDYAGQERNRFNAYYKIGERAPGIEKGIIGKGPAAAAAAAAAAAKSGMQPSKDPLQPSPQIPTSPSVQQPIPVQQPLISFSPPPPPPGMEQENAAQPAETLKCGVCQQDVPSDGETFRAHINECMARREQAIQP